MIAKLLYALIGSLVCTGAALAISGGVMLSTKRNQDLQRLAERYVLALGRAAAELAEGSKARRAAEAGLDQLSDAKLVQDVRESRAAERLGELAHYYNVGVWTLAGYALCFVMAVLLGVSSVLDAFRLGLKVMVTLFFVQAGLLLYCATQGCKLL